MQTSIRAAIDQLEELADGGYGEALAALRDRLTAARLRVLITGEAKRGKSTLANALLGREVLPAGVTPLTAVPATVVHAPADQEGIEVRFLNGDMRSFPLADLAAFGTERGNPGNCRQVAAVTVRLNAPLLSRGVELVDTPGVGSIHAHNTAAAADVLPSMDAAIFVLTADPPVSASERDLLRRVAGLSVVLFVVLNKADYLDPGSLAEAMAFTSRVVAETIGHSEQVYALSARAALGAAGDPGFESFAADFLAFLNSGRIAGLESSVSRHLRRIGGQLQDEVTLARRAAQLPGEEAGAELAAFAGTLAALASRQVDAEDRATAQSGRLLEALNSAAEQARSRLFADLNDRMAGVLDSELAAASPTDIEHRGRNQLTGMVAEAVDEWRQEQAAVLEQGLADLDQKLADELAAGLATVRCAAAELLGIELALPSPGERLAPDVGFFYLLREQVDQSELLAGAIRRRLPGDYGRRLARQRLLGEVPDLVGSQLGRARGDLQYRLAEATRRLTADVRHRYAETAGRLTEALDRADRIRADAGEQAGQQLAGLATREQALREVLASLPDGGEDAVSVAANSGVD
ncbi:MAG TPA: dynamin family protein [Streptosporangiaceae bacterium]